MDLFTIDEAGSEFFLEFVKSPQIQENIERVEVTFGVYVAVLDLKGNFIYPFKFAKTHHLKELAKEFAKGVVRAVKGVNHTIFLSIPAQKAFFIVVPIYSQLLSRSRGYILAGPYKTPIHHSKEQVVVFPVPSSFVGTLKEKVFSKMTKEKESFLASYLDSVSSLAASLYDEKVKKEESIKRLSGLYSVNMAITKTLNLQEVLQIVLDKAIELLKAEYGSIMLLNKDTEELKIFVAHGLSQDIIRNTRIKLGESVTGKVAKEGKPRILLKGVRDSISKSCKKNNELLASMSVPLKVKGEVIGVLNISGKKDGGNFTLEDLNLLEAFAANASTAIHNARLYNQIQKRVEELEAMFDLGTAIVSTLHLKDVLKKVLANAIKLLNAKHGSLMLLDEKEGVLEIEVAHGLPLEVIKNTKIPLGEGISGKVALEGKPKILKKGEKDVKGGERKEYPASLSVPLKFQGRVIGVLNVKEKTTEDNFTFFDVELLTLLASQAAVAIENARLYQQVQKKLKELSALFDLGTTIVSTLNRREVLEKVLENAIHLLHAKDGSLMLLNPEKKVLEIEVAHGLPEEVIKKTKIKLGEGISGKVALEGKPRLLKKGKKAKDSKSNSKVFPSALSVPLKFHNQVIGVLNVKDKKGGEDFSDSDVELLSLLASLGAIAIKNAELHKSLENLFVNSIKALANAIEARDPYTRGHSERVSEYSVKIAQYMGMDPEEIKKIRYAALLHDIGKINIKEEILNKPGKLTEEEFRIMHQHPTLGAKIMEPVKEFRDILPYMVHHHERYGSGGYPDGVEGEKIPLQARILAVADSFDAMTSDRPYRKALPIEVAIRELKENAGTQFDPKVVEVFLQIYEKEPKWIRKTMHSAYPNHINSQNH